MNPSQRILLVYRVNLGATENLGIFYKMLGQQRSFSKFSSVCDVVFQNGNEICLNIRQLWKNDSFLRIIPLKFCFFQMLRHKLDPGPYSIIYIRFAVFTPAFYQWIKSVKSLNPGCKIILEYPTLPYEKEWRGAKGKLAKMINQLFRAPCERLIELKVIVGNPYTGSSINTLHITNGIDLSSIPVKQIFPRLDHVHLLAIGKWQFWHGLDRILKAISDYRLQKQDFKILLSVAGDGPETAKLKLLTKQLQLEDRVKFYGPVSGNELNLLVDSAHLGIGTLAMFRKNLSFDSSLKHREYCARGLPFVTNSSDPDFPDSTPFVLKLSSEELPIDMTNLIEFILNLRPNAGLSLKIRKYAEKNLSWDPRVIHILKALEEAKCHSSKLYPFHN